MKDDPIVDEVRKAGEAYFAKFNFDLGAVCEDLRRSSKEAMRETISLSPKRIRSLGYDAQPRSIRES